MGSVPGMLPLVPVAMLHVLVGVVASLNAPPSNPWPVAICAVALVAFVGIVAIAATVANRRDDRHRRAS